MCWVEIVCEDAGERPYDVESFFKICIVTRCWEEDVAVESAIVEEVEFVGVEAHGELKVSCDG